MLHGDVRYMVRSDQSKLLSDWVITKLHGDVTKWLTKQLELHGDLSDQSWPY